ncbi:hypothetical protein L596_028555 [Steinernema carpocapsae]|uniref:RING-CH-type domain-containing protein n=1 Tax=Steinernema carpocapsae TaxID=34508 RepID=A0A4U5LYT7_STECR|nr:hypothetical protein L596_028555 [Steinernema carpocapsae]
MDEEEGAVCRICWRPSEEPLYHPCQCDGSLRYIHQACWDRWAQLKNTSKCDVCKEDIRQVYVANGVLDKKLFSAFYYIFYSSSFLLAFAFTTLIPYYCARETRFGPFVISFCLLIGGIALLSKHIASHNNVKDWLSCRLPRLGNIHSKRKILDVKLWDLLRHDVLYYGAIVATVLAIILGALILVLQFGVKAEDPPIPEPLKNETITEDVPRFSAHMISFGMYSVLVVMIVIYGIVYTKTVVSVFLVVISAYNFYSLTKILLLTFSFTAKGWFPEWYATKAPLVYVDAATALLITILHAVALDYCNFHYSQQFNARIPEFIYSSVISHCFVLAVLVAPCAFAKYILGPSYVLNLGPELDFYMQPMVGNLLFFIFKIFLMLSPFPFFFFLSYFHRITKNVQFRVTNSLRNKVLKTAAKHAVVIFLIALAVIPVSIVTALPTLLGHVVLNKLLYTIIPSYYCSDHIISFGIGCTIMRLFCTTFKDLLYGLQVIIVAAISTLIAYNVTLGTLSHYDVVFFMAGSCVHLYCLFFVFVFDKQRLTSYLKYASQGLLASSLVFTPGFIISWILRLEKLADGFCTIYYLCYLVFPLLLSFAYFLKVLRYHLKAELKQLKFRLVDYQDQGIAQNIRKRWNRVQINSLLSMTKNSLKRRALANEV